MDFRIDCGFVDHPKTAKLQRILGPAGPWSLVCLFSFCASNKRRADGDLSGLDDEDIAVASRWGGLAGDLIGALTAVGYLEGEPGAYRVHDWKEHQPWAARARQRSAAASRNISVRWHKAGKHAAEADPDCPLCAGCPDAESHTTGIPPVYDSNTSRIPPVYDSNTSRIPPVYDSNTSRIRPVQIGNTPFPFPDPKPSHTTTTTQAKVEARDGETRTPPSNGVSQSHRLDVVEDMDFGEPLDLLSSEELAERLAKIRNMPIDYVDSNGITQTDAARRCMQERRRRYEITQGL